MMMMIAIKNFNLKAISACHRNMLINQNLAVISTERLIILNLILVNSKLIRVWSINNFNCQSGIKPDSLFSLGLWNTLNLSLHCVLFDCFRTKQIILDNKSLIRYIYIDQVTP